MLTNDLYRLEPQPDGSVRARVAGMPPQTWSPVFAVVRSASDPGLLRTFSHPNHVVAPRPALRWMKAHEPLDALNAWLDSPPMREAMGLEVRVTEDAAGGRTWTCSDRSGRVKLRVEGRYAGGTSRPFAAGETTVLRASGAAATADGVRWEFPRTDDLALSATLTLPPGAADPSLTFELQPARAAFYSVAYLGAPDAPFARVLRVPQECAGPLGRQFDFVLSEADLKLPRAQVTTAEGTVAVVADPCECRFRLPTAADARFGVMLAGEGGRLRPVLLAPVLGGAESRMPAGRPWRFTLRLVTRAGDWKETFRHIACDLHGFRDLRDHSGPGPLNGCFERAMDFLAGRDDRNRALWHDEQKYYDYFTDASGVFKPFSPLYGLSAAIVADDEDFYRRRARPAIEFALSRRRNFFEPYEGADQRMISAAGRELGGPYPGYAQLLALHEILQRRSPAVLRLAEERGPAPGSAADALARWQWTRDPADRAAAVKLGAASLARGGGGEAALFDFLDFYDATGDRRFLDGAAEAAYRCAASLNLYPAPPATNVTVDAGGRVPVHAHSVGRHRNIWGFPPPVPLAAPEQTVPAWRVARLGLPSIAYPVEYWMNVHGALMRTAGLAGDDFLRDLARWGMVGRFGNYPGDNRSQVSLVGELPDAVVRPPWEWNFATVNPGHAWDFAAAVLDFLVSDAFQRSAGRIDFPARSSAGSNFRVRLYGDRPGRFYDREGVRLWMPPGLVRCDNRQVDWLAVRGEGLLGLALMNQSFRAEQATVAIDPARAVCADGEAGGWINGAPAPLVRVASNRFEVALPPKGLIALALPARTMPHLQARLFADDVPAWPAPGPVRVDAPFGRIHAMTISAGRGLASAFVYTEAMPETTIAATLRWRQGGGAWREAADAIFPYEFTVELDDGGGDFRAVMDVETARRKVVRSAPIVLRAGPASPGAGAAPEPPPSAAPSTAAPERRAAPGEDAVLTPEFLDYLQRAANPKKLGLGPDGRFRPYSTPLGRRIGARLPVWDPALYERGCTPEEAARRLRETAADAAAAIRARLAADSPATDLDTLDRDQREMLVDFALTETAQGIGAGLLDAILRRDRAALASGMLYVRWNGASPDAARNKAFADRWLQADAPGRGAAR